MATGPKDVIDENLEARMEWVKTCLAACKSYENPMKLREIVEWARGILANAGRGEYGLGRRLLRELDAPADAEGDG